MAKKKPGNPFILGQESTAVGSVSKCPRGFGTVRFLILAKEEKATPYCPVSEEQSCKACLKGEMTDYQRPQNRKGPFKPRQ